MTDNKTSSPATGASQNSKVSEGSSATPNSSKTKHEKRVSVSAPEPEEPPPVRGSGQGSLVRQARRASAAAAARDSVRTGSSQSRKKVSIKRRLTGVESEESYDEYLFAMKRVNRESQATKEGKRRSSEDTPTPRERYRRKHSLKQSMAEQAFSMHRTTAAEATRISIIASMVPDEIIYKHSDYECREFDVALMFVDVSGFTDLCETYTRAGHGGPSRLTQVLNSYMGAMVQEVLTHGGDVLKFSGDAFLAVWRSTARRGMQDAVHAAIDCSLLIQKNHGTQVTDVGVILKVKAAISAGHAFFSVIGDEKMSHYVIVGQPVWDCKGAEARGSAGDVVAAPSAWAYVNGAEYCTKLLSDGTHTKVLGVGATWKRVERLGVFASISKDAEAESVNLPYEVEEDNVSNPLPGITYREFALRPSVVAAMSGSWWQALRKFMVAPVLRAVDNDEPMDFLTEVRRVVIVFLNIVNRPCSERDLVVHVDKAYKCVCGIVSESGGLVNKVSLFDKDMMFLVAFGLRGLKHEDEAQKALQCAVSLRDVLALDDNFVSVSVGVTSGTTYCGVVGHTLRREYTVIGSPVNKAARLMTNYPNKVTCDKETFLRSKLEQEYFVLMEAKELKGIPKPGPIYEFIKIKPWSQRNSNSWRHPILGRSSELRTFRVTLLTALKQQRHRFTRYRDHRYAVAISGPKMAGKTRLMEECLHLTPKFIPAIKLVLSSRDKIPYGLVRRVFMKPFGAAHASSVRMQFEHKIGTILHMEKLTAVESYALNVIFDCRFPLPERFAYSDNILAEPLVKTLLQEVCTTVFPNMWLYAIEEGHFIDDQSWQALLIIMETKTTFFLITLPSEEKLTNGARRCLKNNSVVRLFLSGIDRWYHAALACQMLDVQSIPADLEKVIQSSSGGMPGWIQNYVVALVQSGWLQVVSGPREAALAAGAVLPTPTLLSLGEAPSVAQTGHGWDLFRTSYKDSHINLVKTSLDEMEPKSDIIQMAVLTEGYNFEDMALDMTMDAIILKTYDSLTPFEKMLLKCSSVLGDVFSRRMLEHLLQSDSSRKLALAVKKLFEIRVLACEGGDFTRDTSLVLVHPAPAHHTARPPHCSCLGNHQPPDCRDLPQYAFCGYMRFKHSLFRATTYDLLTESQKHELHARALMFLERFTRRCVACGTDCFIKLLGQWRDDGLTRETSLVLKARKEIRGMCDEGEMRQLQPAGGPEVHRTRHMHAEGKCQTHKHLNRSSSSIILTDAEDAERLQQEALIMNRSKNKRVRSFSSFEIANCECLTILLAVYSQLIDHCRGASEWNKLLEGYLEFASLSMVCFNIPQAIRLLLEVENFVMGGDFGRDLEAWQKSMVLGRIVSLRGACMLESGDLSEARKHLFNAMDLYACPFPTSKHAARLLRMRVSFKQTMMLYALPSLYVGRESGLAGNCFEEVADTLNYLHLMFMESKEPENAELAAKWSLNMALRTDTNYRLLCVSYANMITVSRLKRDFTKCMKLEALAMELCHRKYCQLDVTEVHAVCCLYTSIFRFYVVYGKKPESIDFGLTVMHLLNNLTDLTNRQMLILWLLKLLLAELRLTDMVSIMRELFYMTDHYDVSSETWYYYMAIVIHLDTGYCVESYSTCERFYMKKGEGIMRSKTPEAAWNFFVTMWLMCVRMSSWERSVMWEEKISTLVKMKFREEKFNMMITVKLVEGLLITLVKEMDNRNIRAINELEKTIRSIFKEIEMTCKSAVMYKPRFWLLKAYFFYIRHRKRLGFRWLEKSYELSKKLGHGTILLWSEHTRRHWRGSLNPLLVDYWTEHAEPGQLIDYRQFEADKGLNAIIPYTLPLPRHI